MTVLEAIQRGAAFLESKGVESARLQAELLLAHALGVPRLQLYLKFDRVLTEEETGKAREYFRRRGQREPLQHIVGTTGFCGLEFEVGPEALIPRPETELLAEQAWTWLGASGGSAPAVLDFGTGTGCLAITLAVRCPGARVWAVDVSEAALGLARRNAARHGVESRVEFLLGDGFGALPAGLRFDCLMSNPPYIAAADLGGLEPEVRDHDPRLALDGGEDGLVFYRRLAAEGAGWLGSGGRLFAELGDGQAGAVRGLFEFHKWVVEGVVPDYSGRERILRARAPGE